MSGNNDNDNANYNNLTKKEQENISAQKAGELGARAVSNVATGGKYEKFRNIPVVGGKIKKQEKKIGKQLAKSDKKSGGQIGKIAKKLDDNGILDKTGQAMNLVGGKPRTNSMKSSSQGSNIVSPQRQSSPTGTKTNISSEQNGRIGQGSTTNFAKNGLNNDNRIPNGNSEGATRNRLSNIFNRKKSRNDGGKLDGSSSSNSNSNSTTNNNEDNKVDIAAELTKKFLKKSLIPFIVFFVFILLIMAIITSEDSDKIDVMGGDSLSYEDVGADSKAQKDFYDTTQKIREEYKDNGKEINSMYITATYHILNRYKGTKYNDMTEQLIREMADGMLDGSTVYTKEAYTKYLKEKLLPNYFNDNKIDSVINEIFEYIDEYMEDVYGKDKKQSCTSTTGGSCTYTFNGVHGLNSESINLSNIQVRLMSSSDCPGGTDNVVLDEPLIPFEEYVLGVGYGELGPYYNYEVAKVHMIAARSFALSVPYYKRGTQGVKISKEGNQQILQIRSCVADQVYCNPKLGCSADYVINLNSQPMIYSGTTHPYVYQKPLSNFPDSKIENAWKETMGMVAVDKDNKVVLLPYAINNQREDPHDPRVWIKWAESGQDYKAIMLAAYPEVKEIKQFSCVNTKESSDNAFLKTAKEVWTEVTNRFKEYQGGGNQVPPTGDVIDCSTYVDWVLYKYGYDDFKGYQKPTEYFFTTNLNEKYGWTEISVEAGEDVTNKLQPGDILVRHRSNADGHMDIITEVKSDGSVWGYDAGQKSNWLYSKGGKETQISTSFIKNDSRPGKIIRVNNNGTGDTCQTAESGEWQQWRQDGEAPWKNIPLGNSGRTIGSHGCYVTSIAIQIARSGAKTNLPVFNPGTLVTELNKNNSFDNGGALTWQGESNISKYVPGFKTVASHVSVGSTKEQQIATINKYIDQGYYVILNVKGGEHWVPVIGTTKDNIQMRDPSSEYKNVYDYYTVSGCLSITVFDIK